MFRQYALALPSRNLRKILRLTIALFRLFPMLPRQIMSPIHFCVWAGEVAGVGVSAGVDVWQDFRKHLHYHHFLMQMKN